MTLREISYELLTLIRSGYVSDDERIDLRLLEEPIRQYRAEYIRNLNRIEKTIPESFVQTFNVPLAATAKDSYTLLESNSAVPGIIIGRFGPMISGIYSPYVDEFSYSVVNRTRLKYSGNGKFNNRILYVAYYDNNLKFKSKDSGYLLMTDVDVSAVLKDPTELTGFDVEVDDYPIDADAIPYIKDKMSNSEIRLLLAQFSDEINDASGEIKE